MDFYTIGILIVRPIIQNDEDPLSKPVKAFVENEAPLEVSFIRLTDEWHRFLPNYLQVMAGTKNSV